MKRDILVKAKQFSSGNCQVYTYEMRMLKRKTRVNLKWMVKTIYLKHGIFDDTTFFHVSGKIYIRRR